MILTQLRLPPDSIARLAPEEQSFLALAGQFSNDLTILHKLVTASFREPPDELEHKANAVLVAVLLKTLASKLWQGWELVTTAYDGLRVGKAQWLRDDNELQAAFKTVRDYFTRPNILEAIRNQFGYHYDSAPVAAHLADVLATNGFEMLYGDRIVNGFYLSSELASWSAILGTTDEAHFPERIRALILEVAAKSGEFLDLLNHIARAFCTHIVQDLGGHLLKEAEAHVPSVEPNHVVFPLFTA